MSSSEKSGGFFAEMLDSILCGDIVTAGTCGEARRILLEREVDLCVINSPLPDESGEGLSIYISSSAGMETCQVILVVKGDFYDEISANVEEYGVITVSKPMSRNLFLSALKTAKAAHKKISMLRDKNSQLIQKIEDIRIVNRAKLILISSLAMTEPEAHRYIEKQAMNTRATKREVAERILKTYEGE